MFQSTFILRRPRVAILADIFKIWTMFISTMIEDSKRELEIMYQMESVSVFLDIATFADFQWKNPDVSRTQGIYHVTHTFFGSSLGKV